MTKMGQKLIKIAQNRVFLYIFHICYLTK